MVEEDMDVDMAGKCSAMLEGRIMTTLITYLEHPKDILELAQRAGTKFIQVHGSISTDDLVELKRRLPGHFVMKSLVVGRDGDPHDFVGKYQDYVDYFITDTFDPNTGQSGATGKQHDPAISRMVVERSKKPVILAGGA